MSLRDVYGVPPSAIPGWKGDPVEYWRVPSLYSILSELAIYSSPYREWLDSELDMVAMCGSAESLTRMWFYEITPLSARRQWVRGAYEYLQAFHKVTSGTPVDSQISSHLVDVDAVISADRNFVRFAQVCRNDAPFPVAESYLISGGPGGVRDLLTLMPQLRRAEAPPT